MKVKITIEVDLYSKEHYRYNFPDGGHILLPRSDRNIKIAKNDDQKIVDTEICPECGKQLS